MTQDKSARLLDNSRFYILAISGLLSVATAAYLRLQISSDQLYYIRTQQIFGLFCILYWYLALIISPIGYVIGKRHIKQLEFARRAIGVTAAYFATLHAAISLWGQLGGISELSLLPSLFKWSLGGGAISLLILLILTVTSLDKAIELMTYKKWNWLHRLVYGGLILAILHIWTIGSHLSYPKVQLVAFIALAILAGLEIFRLTKLLNDKYLQLNKVEYATLWFSMWAISLVIIACIPIFVENYRSKHVEHRSHSEMEHKQGETLD
jgi:DMSO/TMAO reductase YedYZ heme-binding membrane subunit